MKSKVILYYFPAIIAIFVIWDVVAKIVALPIIPAPELVVQRLSEIFMDTIAIHMVYSLGRIIVGVSIAIIIGVPLGTLLGYTHIADKFLSPLVYLMYPIPKIALLPIVMLLFGIGEIPKVLIIFLIVIFQLLVTMRDTIAKIPKEFYYPLNSLGASFPTIFIKIIWPASLPSFLTALRVAMGTAISVLFFTETFGTIYGMGYFIMDAWMRVNYLDMYAGIVVLSGMGLGLFAIIDYCEWKLCRWQR